jgi:hypothetical protein
MGSWATTTERVKNGTLQSWFYCKELQRLLMKTGPGGEDERGWCLLNAYIFALIKYIWVQRRWKGHNHFSSVSSFYRKTVAPTMNRNWSGDGMSTGWTSETTEVFFEGRWMCLADECAPKRIRTEILECLKTRFKSGRIDLQRTNIITSNHTRDTS